MAILNNRPKQNIIGRRLAIAIILFSSVITLVITFIQIYFDYRQNLNLINMHMDMIKNTYLESLVNSVWMYDEKQMQVQLNGLARLQDIEYIEIIDDNKEKWSAGVSKSTRVIKSNYPLIKHYKGKNISLGVINVTAGLDSVYRRLIDKAVLILCSNALKTFIVSGFILFIFHYMVTRHLYKLAYYFSTIDLSDKITAFNLNRKSKPGKKEDEFDLLINAVNRMQHRLDKSYKDIDRLNVLLTSIINSMPSALIGINRDKEVTHWNNEAEKLTGIEAINAYTQNISSIIPLMKGQMDKIELALKEQRPLKEEKIAWTFQGRMFYVDLIIYPLFIESIEGAVIRIDDITGRVEVEEMMIQSEKMVSIGEMAAGMAHEINNPLAGILQNIQVIRNRLIDKNQVNKRHATGCGISLDKLELYMNRRNIFQMIESVMESGQRAANIVNNMLNFSRKNGSKPSANKLDELLDDTIKLLENDFSLKKDYDLKNIEFIREYPKDMLEVMCQGSKIQQVFYNVLKNSVQAMAEMEEPCSKIIILRIKQDAGMAKIEIEDNGPGMNEKTRKRIFEPFFTTKPVGVGTGLGLSVSYYIICNTHKGTMSVHSIPGKGSKFIINIPVQQ